MTDAAPPPSEPTSPHRDRFGSWGLTLLVAVGIFAVYLPTLARGATFTDGPEITTAIHRLGVIHPTGYPLFTMLAHGFTRLCILPLPVIVKVELFNALCGVGSALLVARSARLLVLYLAARAARMAVGMAPGAAMATPVGSIGASLPLRDRQGAELAGVVAGLLVGVSPLLWAQVRIPEVYPFQVLLVCAAMAAWIRFEITDQNGYVVLAALPMGMGLAHHVTMVYFLPAAFIYLLARKPLFFVAWLVYPVARLVRLRRPTWLESVSFAGWWAFPVACLVGFVPLLSYGYLIWANAHTDGVPWGDIKDWPALWDHMTGKQYHGFMKLKELGAYWKRIQKLPVVFDEQFLPAGTALFFAGIGVAWRRGWRVTLLLLAYLLFNVGHGVYYAVGDYANYFLPAVVVCALLIAVGLHWLRDKALGWPAPTRLWAVIGAVSAMLAVTAGAIFFYATRTNRYDVVLAGPLKRLVALPAGVIAIGIALAALGLWLREPRPTRAVRASTLPRVLTAGLLVVLLGATAIRGRELARKPIVGKSYGEEVTAAMTPGSVLLTQGDGYLFTMWHEHHVLERGLDTATLDMGNLKTPWYQRYLNGRYPAGCDPLDPRFVRDPAQYEEKCRTFRQRMALQQTTTWTSLGLGRGNSRPSPVEVTQPFVRGHDPACEDEIFRKDHADAECRCWDYGKKVGVVEEDCVYTTEEKGIAPREPLEVMAHRIVEDEIDERPLFERNVYTHWQSDTKLNKRGWNGPSYLRPPGQYDLLNRGRVNQIVHHEDLEPFADPCASPTARPVALRELRPASSSVRRRARELYAPNDRATLITATYLTAEPEGSDDDASRRFRPGDSIYVKVDWFEKFYYDASKPERRGDAVREGVRFCFFGPDGGRVAVQSTVSGYKDIGVVLGTAADAATGRYLVQACSVGEIGERPPPFDELPCRRILLEYDFAVER